MVDIVIFLNTSHPNIDRFHHDYSFTTTPLEHKSAPENSFFYYIHFKY